MYRLYRLRNDVIGEAMFEARTFPEKAELHGGMLVLTFSEIIF